MTVTIIERFNKFPGMPTRLRADDHDIRMKWAFDAAAAADPYTPVDTGAMKNNKDIGLGYVHWLQLYTAFQNNGTVHIAPKLFANHGVDVATPGAIAAYRQLESRLV